MTCRTLLEKHGRTHKWIYSYGPPHMAEQRQDGQHEHTFSKDLPERWTIGKSGERGSGISVLHVARHDDDDDASFLKKINSNKFFLQSEDCYHDSLYWPSRSDFFFFLLPWSQCFPLHGHSFHVRFLLENTYLANLLKFLH